MASADDFARFHPSNEVVSPARLDPRTETARDRDRVIHTLAFRRLAEVTQVVRPIEGHVFHNRLTHTLEVAQVARRMAERLEDSNSAVDPEAAEAGALAHDLGHPPFGHLAEKELDRLVKEHGAPDGFEGNAQSFRIVNALTAHGATYRGLNLTRRTMRALLKYPWRRSKKPPKHDKKFGAYLSELSELDWALVGVKNFDRSIEAEIMDHADDITYSVHDFDDFYRVGLIPLELLDDEAQYEDEIKAFKASAKERGQLDPKVVDKYRSDIDELIALLPCGERYVGRYDERREQRQRTAGLIHKFVMAPQIKEKGGIPHLDIPQGIGVQMKFLQDLVWRYVIQSPRLATQQEGQRRIIRGLFEYYYQRVRSGQPADVRMLPPLIQQETEEIRYKKGPYTRDGWAARLTADLISSFGEKQAVSLYRRLIGVDGGAITDLI